MHELRTWPDVTMTANAQTVVWKRADAHRSEMAARMHAERDACAVWRACLGCGRPFTKDGIHVIQV